MFENDHNQKTVVGKRKDHGMALVDPAVLPVAIDAALAEKIDVPGDEADRLRKMGFLAEDKAEKRQLETAQSPNAKTGFADVADMAVDH